MDIINKLVNLYLSNPEQGEALAHEFGLWDSLYETVFKPLQLSICQSNINHFIEHVFVDIETNEHVLQQSFHKEWQTLIKSNNRILIAAPRGHGKCQIAGTKLSLRNGSKVKVENIPIGEEFDCITWTPDIGYSIQKASVWQSSIQPCYRITTKSGRTTGYSEEHPCWTGRGWITTKNLIPGDTFAVARNIPGGQENYSIDKAWLLGLLIGDGSLTVRSRVELTCGDPNLELILPKLIARCGFSYRIVHCKGNCRAYFITGGATGWIKQFGLNEKSSHTKFVPKEVFTWNNEVVAAFLRGYFDADGCVSMKGKVVEYSSVNYSLLLDTQSLLLRFGIVSSIRVKNGTYNKQPHVSYKLQINGSSLSIFANIIGNMSSKGQKLQTLMLSIGTSNDNIDLIPEDVLNRLQVQRGCRTDKRDGCDISNRRKRGSLRHKVQTLAYKQNRQDLYNEADLFWDEVTSVDYIGEQQTYSVEVKNTHTHITDDFITHNTVQIMGYIIWKLGHNPNLRIKIIGSSDEKSKEILGLVREVIDKDDRVHEVFPNLTIDKDRGDTKTAFFVNRTIRQRDPSVEASGVMSTGAGGRADILICDDVVDLKNSVINPAMREQVINAVKETWFSLVSSTGQIVWIATPYHIADATHNLKNTGEFKVWWTPAINYEMHFEDDGSPIINPETNQQKITKIILWPSKWSEEKLEAQKALVGDRVFARQYLLNAMSDEEKIFPESSLERSYDITLANIGEDIESDWITYGGVDLATALGKKNAWTVIWTLAKNPHNGKLYLKEMYRRRMGFPDTIKAIKEQYRRHDWRLCLVENNGYQQAVIQAFEENDKQIPIESFTTGINKADEKVGLPGLAVAFEKSKFAIPAAKFPLSPDNPSPLTIFMNELSTYPGGEFSDTIMAFWFAWTAAQRNAGDFEDAWMEASLA